MSSPHHPSSTLRQYPSNGESHSVLSDKPEEVYNMTSINAKSTKKYNLPFGESVKTLDKVSGIRLSEEVAKMLLTGLTNADKNDSYTSAKWIVSLKLPASKVYDMKFGRGVNEGKNQIFSLKVTGKELTRIASLHVTLYDTRIANIHQISGDVITSKKGIKGGNKGKVYNFSGKVKSTKKTSPDTLPDTDTATA
jgi:hypothetical protein